VNLLINGLQNGESPFQLFEILVFYNSLPYLKGPPRGIRTNVDKPSNSSSLKKIGQVVKYKSPFMWFGLIATNVAIRNLQPAVVDMVASRAIELYSGQLLPEADHSFHLANTG